MDHFAQLQHKEMQERAEYLKTIKTFKEIDIKKSTINIQYNFEKLVNFMEYKKANLNRHYASNKMYVPSTDDDVLIVVV